jgi:hypothetical protein
MYVLANPEQKRLDHCQAETGLRRKRLLSVKLANLAIRYICYY